MSEKSCCDSLDSPGALWRCFDLDIFEGTAAYSGEKGRVDSKKGITCAYGLESTSFGFASVVSSVFDGGLDVLMVSCDISWGEVSTT